MARRSPSSRHLPADACAPRGHDADSAQRCPPTVASQGGTFVITLTRIYPPVRAVVRLDMQVGCGCGIDGPSAAGRSFHGSMAESLREYHVVKMWRPDLMAP